MENPVDLLRFESDGVRNRIGLISIDSIGNESRNRKAENQEATIAMRTLSRTRPTNEWERLSNAKVKLRASQ